MEFFKKISPFILILILSLPAIWSLFGQGYFPMHDDTQVARVYEMTAALREGQFPVRWVKDLGYGYGYPIFNFYAPLPYYVAGVIHLLGIDVVSATKIMFGSGLFLAGITMYFLGKTVWGKWGGFLSAVFYVYAPYHAVQVYVRGAVGEYWAYGILPVLFLGLYVISTPNNSRSKDILGILCGSLGLAGVILSHNITGMLVFPFLFLWLCIVTILLAVKQKSQKVFVGTFYLRFVALVLLGIGLSAFFWLPAISESQFTWIETLVQGTNNFRDHFLYLDQLWDSPWGYGGSTTGRSDGMSFKIGKLHALVAILGLLTFFYKIHKSPKTKVLLEEKFPIITISSLGILLSVFMMLPLSKPVWEVMSPLAYVQYPWRFLVFCLFFISLLSGSFIYSLGKGLKLSKLFYVVGGVVMILLIGWNNKYFQPKYLYPLSTEDINPKTISWKYSRISDEYLPINFPLPVSEDQVKQQMIHSESDIIIKDQQVGSRLWDMNISAFENADVLFHLAYFPGWRSYIDAREVMPTIQDGLLLLTVPEGTHQVKLVFGDTPIRLVANAISGFSVILSMAIWVRQKYDI